MFKRSWLLVISVALAFCFWQAAAFADHDQDRDEDHGHGHAYGHEKHDRDDEHGRDDRHNRDGDGDRGYYRDHDRELREWYSGHEGHLPPGLAKRDALPPGLQRQLVVRGTLPPGLRRKMYACPKEVEVYLPPAPVGYMHTVIGGNIVLVNRRTFFVLDVFKF